jgi:hypothetical protein
MMDMVNDSREVDWAPNQIAQLKSRVDDGFDELRRLVEQLKVLELKIAWIRDVNGAHSKRLGDLVEKQIGLAEKMSWVQDTGAEFQQQVEQSTVELRNRVRRLENNAAEQASDRLKVKEDNAEYSPPIGGLTEDPSLRPGEAVAGDWSLFKKTEEDKGLKALILGFAENRIRVYMKSVDVDPDFIGGVVRALYGGDNPG